MNGPKIALFYPSFGVIFLIWYFARPRGGTPVEMLLLAITALATVVGTAGGLYLQHRGNKHFAEQNRIMIEQSPKPSRSGAMSYKPPYWPLVAMVVMVFLTVVIAGYDYFDRHRFSVKPTQSTDWNAWTDQKLKRVSHQTYSNETVQLDGYEFIDTTFDNVYFMYEGRAPVRFTNVHFKNPSKPGVEVARFGSNNPVVKTAIQVVEIVAEVSGCGVGLMVRPND
jgi:hypothetical protein